MYFFIDGYWKDDKSEFESYIVREFDDSIGDDETDEGLTDNDIFFYGLSEQGIKSAISEGEEAGGEFVITAYRIREN